MAAAVEVRDLRVVLGGVPALSPVSFSLPRGRCLGVTGANGSGKTTLLRVLAGVQTPTEGAAMVEGHRCDERDHGFRRQLAAHIGYPPVARDLTVEEHLRLVSQSWGTGPEAAAELVDSLARELGLARLVRRFPHQLSTGQSQLFTLALTLCRPCTVLVMDEPEHRLDDSRVGTVVEALRSRIASGTTVVLATHDHRFLEGLSDELLHLEASA